MKLYVSSVSCLRAFLICYTVLLVAVIKCFKTEGYFLALTSNICNPSKRKKKFLVFEKVAFGAKADRKRLCSCSNARGIKLFLRG